MIQVDRGAEPSGPKYHQVLKQLKDSAQLFFRDPYEERQQLRHDFGPFSVIPDIIEKIHERFRGKCAYCESRIFQDLSPHIDRFRPVARTLGLDGRVYQDHYWWLAYEWENLYAACVECDRIKGTRFPVEGSRAEWDRNASTLVASLAKEKPLLIDPCRDVPEEFFFYDENGRVASDETRGRVTINILGLNRPILVESRARLLHELQASWAEFPVKRGLGVPWGEMIRELGAICGLDHEYLALRRQFCFEKAMMLARRRPSLKPDLESYLRSRTAMARKLIPPDQGDAPVSLLLNSTLREVGSKVFADFAEYEQRQKTFSVEQTEDRDYYLKTRLIDSVEIENFKAIRKLKLVFPKFPDETGRWLMLLGENGTGKSSILQAVALTLMNESQRDSLRIRPSDVLRRGTNSGSVTVCLSPDGDKIVLRFKRKSLRFRIEPAEAKVLLLAYGATRLPRPAKLKPLPKPKSSGIRNLFEPFTHLIEDVRWLRSLRGEAFHSATRALKTLLPNDKPEDIQIVKGTPREGMLISLRGTEIPFRQLSDGYRSVFALAVDIMCVMSLKWEAMEVAEGIVLIDEIDAHLHPRWKMQIITRLRQVFPRVQFLVTSHDPLCLRGLHGGEVSVIRRSEGGDIFEQSEGLPSPESLRVDQILTSEYFGLNSTSDPQTDMLFEEYYKLLEKQTPSNAEKSRLGEVKLRLKELELLGSTRREQILLQATDRYLAKDKAAPSGGLSDTEREAALEEIAGLWEGDIPDTEAEPEGEGRP